MTHIKVVRGLDIPIEAGPETGGDKIGTIEKPKRISYPFSSFEDVKLRPLVAPGDAIKIGQPLCEDKDVPGRMFTSTAAGTVFDVRRGEKRKLLDIIIDVQQNEEHIQRKPLAENAAQLDRLSKDALVAELLAGGLFAHIRSRPFNLLANPAKPPRSIFVKALESAPYLPPSELQILGKEHEFQAGLLALKKLTDGPVHLVFRHNTTCKAFLEAKGVEKHTVQGPHPAANASVHISSIDPIKKVDDVVWTVDVLDTIAIGHFLLHGKVLLERVISIAGSEILPDSRGYFRVRAGHLIESIVAGRLKKETTPIRLISGDVLTGTKVEKYDFLDFSDTSLCALSDTTSRQFLHFFRLGKDQYTASGAYLSGHLNPKTHKWPFTTSQHGEERAFIDGSVYERVMPLSVLPMQLVRALLAQDFELAEFHGLLEVAPEDFALPEFVCPSKIEMMDIVKQGLKTYAKDSLG